jgi:hypothetical protein
MNVALLFSRSRRHEARAVVNQLNDHKPGNETAAKAPAQREGR